MVYRTTPQTSSATLIRSHLDGIFEREASTTANGEAESLMTWRSKYLHLKIQGHVGMLEGLFFLLFAFLCHKDVRGCSIALSRETSTKSRKNVLAVRLATLSPLLS